jgi:Lipase (class 3)
MKTVQSILSDVHTEYGVVDVFGTYRTFDVLASIIALSRLQTTAIPFERSRDSNIDSKIKENEVDIGLVQELAHYSKYALAAYGWSLDLALRRKVHLGGNNQTLIRLTGVDRNDIVKTEWSVKAPHRPAYFIVRDRYHKTIVLCIRGTWSAHDMLTNLCCTPQQFDTFRLFHRPLYGHRGMLEAAKAVLGDAEPCIVKELYENPNYSLVLVGHSLGGGCAALLGKLLENRYPTLRVYLFGAPCVVPENTISNRNFISVIADGDPFSCLSLGHVADVSIGLAYLCEDYVMRNDILLRTNGNMNDDDIVWCAATMSVLRKRMTSEKMYPPGRILLLRNDKSRTRRKWWLWRLKRNKAKPYLTDVSTQYFRDLIISAKMFDLSKHLPSMYVTVLSDLANSNSL